MTTTADLLPVLGLRITAGPLELRGITDDLLPELCDLAARGIHAPERMPFVVPWTDVPAEELPRRFAQYHWLSRAEFSPARWSLHLAVLHEGVPVGVQGLSTSSYLVTRTGETGSWLGQGFQGRGIGTAMRQVMCAFAFDHLDAAEITSSAFTDNPASLAGLHQGRVRRERPGTPRTPARGAGQHDRAGADAGAVRARRARPRGGGGGRVPAFRRTGFLTGGPRLAESPAESCASGPSHPGARGSAEVADLVPTRSRLPHPHTTSEETPQTWPSRSV